MPLRYIKVRLRLVSTANVTMVYESSNKVEIYFTCYYDGITNGI